ARRLHRPTPKPPRGGAHPPPLRPPQPPAPHGACRCAVHTHVGGPVHVRRGRVRPPPTGAANLAGPTGLAPRRRITQSVKNPSRSRSPHRADRARSPRRRRGRPDRGGRPIPTLR